MNKDVLELSEKVTKLMKEIEEQKSKSILNNNIFGNRSNSIESQALSYYGCSDVKQLLSINVASPAYAHVPKEVKASVLNLKRSLDIARAIAGVFYKDGINADLDKGRHIEVKSVCESYFAKNVLVPQLKAFGSTIVGAGAETVPTLIASNFIDEYELEFVLASKFREIPMPSGSYNMPVRGGSTIARGIAEGATGTAANFSTSDVKFDAKKLYEFYEIPAELDEDSAVPFLNVGRDEVIRAQLRAYEQIILNGDTSGTHMDSDVTSATDARKFVAKGLRKLALDNSANGSVVTFGSAVTKAKLDEMIQAAGKFSINPRECMFIFGPTGYHQAKAIDEVTTVDKFGPQATMLTGALASFRGIPLAVSQFVREDLNVSGVYDGITTNNTVVYLVNSSRFFMGVRRPIQLKVQPNLPQIDSNLLVSYSRVDFKGVAQNANEVSVILGVDVTA